LAISAALVGGLLIPRDGGRRIELDARAALVQLGQRDLRLGEPELGRLQEQLGGLALARLNLATLEIHDACHAMRARAPTHSAFERDATSLARSIALVPRLYMALGW